MVDQPKATINANPVKKVGSKIESQMNDHASQKSKPPQPPTKTIQPNSNPKAANNAKQDSHPKQASNPKPQPYSVPKEDSDPHQASDPNHSSDPRPQHDSDPIQGSNPNSASDPKFQQNSIATQGNDPDSGSDPTQDGDANHSSIRKPQQDNEPTQGNTLNKGSDSTQGSHPHQGSNPKQDNGKNGDSGQAAESKPNNNSDQVDTIEESNRNTASVILSDDNQTEHADSLNDFTEALASNAPGMITTATAGQVVTAVPNDFAVPGSTLSPEASGVTTNKTPGSLNTADQLLVNSKTTVVRNGTTGLIMGGLGTADPITAIINGQVITANSAALAIAAITLTAGAPDHTLNGTMISLNTADQLVVGTKTIPLKGSSGQIAGLGGSIMGAFGTGGPFGTNSPAPGQGNASMGNDNMTDNGVHVFNGGAASSKGWLLWNVMAVAVLAMVFLAIL